jgi:hypothetical protein
VSKGIVLWGGTLHDSLPVVRRWALQGKLWFLTLPCLSSKWASLAIVGWWFISQSPSSGLPGAQPHRLTLAEPTAPGLSAQEESRQHSKRERPSPAKFCGHSALDHTIWMIKELQVSLPIFHCRRGCPRLTIISCAAAAHAKNSGEPHSGGLARGVYALASSCPAPFSAAWRTTSGSSRC